MNILYEFGMIDCNFFKTPLPQNLKMCKDMDALLVDPKKYKCLVGKLVFLMNTRWDIAFATNFISWFMINPQLVDLQVVKFIIYYIKGTLNFGLLYTHSMELELTNFNAISWGGDANKQKSTCAFVFTFNTPIIVYKKNTYVTLSFTEFEY
jgi:hypothetical protein